MRRAAPTRFPANRDRRAAQANEDASPDTDLPAGARTTDKEKGENIMAKRQAYHHVAWGALSLLVLVADYLTGPAIHFPIAFALPVVLASWYSHRAWGVVLAFLLPAARIGFDFAWGVSPERLEMAVNYVIRVIVLAGLAVLVSHLVALTREIKMLKGILPICSSCKRIRTENGSWKQIESYISEHSDAEFTHGLCVDCAERLSPQHMKKHGHMQRE